jgi:LPXTG-site transpeptidase (sortase) family protein
LAHDERPTSQSLPKIEESARFGLGGIALLTLGIFAISFLFQLLLVSGVYFVKEQQVMHDDFRYDLANASAPVGQVTQDDKLLDEGTPVALIEISKIGLEAVVVEGTSSSALTSGPGHRRDTPLPGQEGTSVIYGRQLTYGGPFQQLSALTKGDKIVTTTGQGQATYTVTGVRYTGDPLPAEFETGGRLTLVSASGFPLVPDSVIRVDATLSGSTKDTPVQMFSVESLSESELPLMGDPGAWPILVIELFCLGLLIVVLWLSLRFWGFLQTWVVGIPVILALGIATGFQVTYLLPNLI